MKIGKYEIIETVRSGTVALFRASDPATKSHVAIKTFNCSGADTQWVRRFQREVRVRAISSHVNIAQILHVGEQDSIIFVVSDWLEGEDLGRFILRQGSLPFETKMDLMLGMVEGLVHAHQSQIVHCDISPGNIFLTKNGIAKILDFGLSHFWYSPFCREQTGKGYIPSLAYRAPEQTAARAYDARADIYSAGVAITQFLTGSAPPCGIGAGTEMPLVRFHMPEQLNAVLHTATKEDPNARYQSALEFLNSLRLALNDVNHRREMIADSISSDCQSILQLILQLEPDFESQQVQDRIKRSGINYDLVEQICGNPSAEFASKLDYLELQLFRDDLQRCVSALADIVTARTAPNSAGDQAPSETRAEETSQSSLGSQAQKAIIQSSSQDLEEAVSTEDPGNAGHIPVPIQADSSLQETATQVIASARSRLAEVALKRDPLYQHVELTVTQLNNALRSGSIPKIPILVEELEYQEKEIANKYPSSGLVSKLIEHSMRSRQEGTSLLLQRGFGEAIQNNGIARAQEIIQKPEHLNAEDPAYVRTLPQLQSDLAKLEDELNRTVKQAVSGEKEKTVEETPAEISEPQANYEKPPLPEEELNKEGKGTRKNTGSELEKLRTRVERLYKEDPEKCLAFLDTMESPMTDDPIIQSYQVKALQARKGRITEIFLTKPPKRPGPISPAKKIPCPVCGALNPIDNTSCSKCHAQLLNESTTAADSSLKEKPGSAPAPLNAAVPPGPLHMRRPWGHGNAKYYLAATVGCLLLILAEWMAVNKYFSPTEAEKAPIGSARTEENAKLKLNENDSKDLRGDTEIYITSLPATQTLDSPVQAFYRDPQTKVFKGTIKLSDLKNLTIKTNPNFVLKHMELKFPADLKSVGSQRLREYIQDIDNAIASLQDAKPTDRLLLKQARGSIYLAQTADSGTPVAKMDYSNAENYLSRLPDDLEDVAALKKQCADFLRAPDETKPVSPPPNKGNCEETLARLRLKSSKADSEYNDEQYRDADRIYDQILKTNVNDCVKTEAIGRLLEIAQKRKKLIAEKLKSQGTQ